MFHKATKSLAKQLDPEGDLIPVYCLLDENHFRLLSVVQSKTKQPWWKKCHYHKTDYKLCELLLPGDYTAQSDIHESKLVTIVDDVDGKLEGDMSVVTLVASTAVTSSATMSHARSVKVKKRHISTQVLDSLHRDRKINMDHQLIKQSARFQRDLYVVTETVKTVEEAEFRESYKTESSILADIRVKMQMMGHRDNKKAVILPKDCTLAFRVKRLLIRGGLLGLSYFPDDKRTTFSLSDFPHGKMEPCPRSCFPDEKRPTLSLSDFADEEREPDSLSDSPDEETEPDSLSDSPDEETEPDSLSDFADEEREPDSLSDSPDEETEPDSLSDSPDEETEPDSLSDFSDEETYMPSAVESKTKEIERKCAPLFSLSPELRGKFFNGFLAIIRDTDLLQELEIQLDQALDEINPIQLKTCRPELQDLLENLKESTGDICLDVGAPVLYFLQALDELTESELLLLEESVERKIVPKQVALVQDILENNFSSQEVPIESEKASPFNRDEWDVTEAIITSSGLTVHRSGARVTVTGTADAFLALGALYVALYVLHVLSK